MFNIGGDTENEAKGYLVQTVLGMKKDNPYTIYNMNKAYHNLYDSTINLETTHYYVKFTPKTYEEVMNLSDNDILLLDFPYEYDVVEMGDYYQVLSEGELPVLYSVVSIDFNLAEYNHQIIDNLYITDNPFLLLEAFYLKGRYSELSNIEIPIDDEIEFPPILPPMPEGGCEAPSHWVLYNQNPNNEYPPDWSYRCQYDPPTGSCYSTDNKRKPYGQIKVDDTQLSTMYDPSTFEGVNGIKVIVADGISFWNYGFTTTNQYGCWKYNKKMWGGARFWAKFQSSTCCVRGIKSNLNIITWPISFSSGIIDYIGKVDANSLHNIQVNYNRNSANNSNAYLFWSAATTNNAIHDFNLYSNQNGINNTPSNLNVFIKYLANGSEGAALMFDKLTPNAINNYFLGLSQSANFTNLFFAGLIDPTIPAYITTVNQALVILAPDVYLGINATKSDKVKSLVYHEVAHSSHYTNTSNAFWVDVMIAESNAYFATGYAHGNATFADADIIAVAESWAEHVALTFADKTYPTYLVTSINATYINYLEKTWNEVPNHIPIGLYHDLTDNGTEPTSYDVYGTGSNIVNDNVTGFTNQMMFSCINANTTSISSFQAQLINTQLANTTNTLTNVNLLFGSY